MQNKMLNNLNQNIDDVDANMVRVEGKMKNLLKNASMCRMWTWLITEFVILIVLIWLSL